MVQKKKEILFKKSVKGFKEDDWLFASDPHKNLFKGNEWGEHGAKRGQELDAYIDEIVKSISLSLDLTLSELAPWFFSNMPTFYYETTPRDEKIRDLRAIITGRVLEQKQRIQLWNMKHTKTTFLARGDDESTLAEIAEEVKNLNIKHGTTIKSKDNKLLISSFNTAEFKKADLSNPKVFEKIIQARKFLKDEGCPDEDVEDFLNHLDHDLIVHSTPARFARLFLMAEKLTTQEDTVTHLIPKYYKGMARFDVAFKNMPIGQTFGSLISILKRYDFVIHRCIPSLVNMHKESPVSAFTFIMEHKTGKRIDDAFVPFLKANKAAKSLKWIDSDQFDLFMKEPVQGEAPYSLNEANLVRSISTWVHIFLSKTSPYTYSEEQIFKTFRLHTSLLSELLIYFRLRCDPRVSGDRQKKMKTTSKNILAKIKSVENPIEQDILKEAHNFLTHILKTNYFAPKKTGLAFRMDPNCLDPDYYPNKPFGFFYMTGRGYRGFQVRFRDTARGGLRIVMPRDLSQYEGNIAGLFDEVIGLSYAQQMKNKDIPEGGSKAVIVVAPGADRRTAAIGAVDSILNLITTEKETGKLHPAIIDHYKKEEFIYLGPDENVTNDLINKFISLAQNYGYRYANAFMSSKPNAGINHKEFGVTSEGINVFLDHLLRELKINPRQQPFTIKMTGGPDGDVAGNMLKFLNRDYGENPRVTAIADGFGAAYDPKGLDWQELLRLVKEEQPISEFQKKSLSSDKRAFVIKADTVENTKKRNTLFSDVEADIFIPAGGRPYTLNDKNWSQFLNSKGNPTAKGVVEGANIFFTEKAREELQKKGLLMFKDSSANKCGVICSSFEILASLILSPEEFLAIKPAYVEQVITKLRSWAGLEAKLLLKEFKERGGNTNLVDLSKELSMVINRVTDLVASNLEQLSEDEFNSPIYQNIILGYVPDAILSKYKERILTALPKSYQKALVSAEIASSIVYREGIAWLNQLPDRNIPQIILTYVQKEQHVKKLIQALAQGKIESLSEISQILDITGARALTQLEMINF